MTATITTQKTAEADPTRHAFMAGLGYVYLGAPENGTATTEFGAPTTLADGARAYLVNGAAKVAFTYRSSTAAWWPDSRTGTRLAFTSAYLASHGWSYGESAS